MQVSLEWLLDPVAPETFFKTYYERAPLLIARNEPDRFQHLLSIGAIDRFLATTTPSYPEVFLVDAGRSLGPDEYTLPNSEDTSLDLTRAYQLFRTGATISIRHLHERMPELAALCRAVEKAFSAHFQTNVYLSPPKAQGFGTHFDSHDVFVLQIAGSKVWTLNDTLIELPLHAQRFDRNAHSPGPVSREFTIRAGDLFYCPRGLFHAARSTDEVSLHVTLGLIGKTWADALTEAVAAACLASPALRANLPPGFADSNFDATEAKAHFRTLLEQFVSGADLDPILERFVHDFVTSRRPDLSGALEAASDAQPIGPVDRLEPRPNLIYRLREENGKITLLFGATAVTFPAYTREPLEFALQGKPFVVRDLPGPLDEPGKLVLAGRLVQEGLLVRAAPVARRAPRPHRAG